MEVREREKENAAMQKQLAKAYEELNKRIHEHDKVVAGGGAVKADITLKVTNEATYNTCVINIFVTKYLIILSNLLVNCHEWHH